MFLLRITLTQKRPPGVVRDKWREICRRAWYIVGEYWFRNFLKQHFTEQAKYKYKHRPRSSKYQRNKERLAQRGIVAEGGRVDNVFRGDLMRAITSQAVIRGFPSRVKVSMFGPSYLRMKFKAGTNQPNKKVEIVTTTQAEQNVLKRLFRQFVVEQIRAIRTQSKTII